MSDFLGCKVINEYTWCFSERVSDRAFAILNKVDDNGRCRVTIKKWTRNNADRTWSIHFVAEITDAKQMRWELKKAKIYNYDARFVED